MHPFESHLIEQVRHALRNVDNSQLKDTYVVSFFVDDYEDDPRLPVLTVGCNTDSRWKSCTPASGQEPRWPIASDSGEAKWNYAFWLQNKLGVIGDVGSTGAVLRESWFRGRGLWYDDELFNMDNEAWSRISSEITHAFVELCIQTTRTLHAEGTIREIFGKSIPVIVHELEYYDEIAEQNTRANPPGVVDEFVSWVTRRGEFG